MFPLWEVYHVLLCKSYGKVILPFFSKVGHNHAHISACKTHEYTCNTSNSVNFLREHNARLNKETNLLEIECNNVSVIQRQSETITALARLLKGVTTLVNRTDFL